MFIKFEDDLLFMKAYLDICEEILKGGSMVSNRTGVDALKINDVIFRHDMEDGFPLLTTKKTAYKPIRSELEFFIGGYTDKKWLQERGNHIWDEWCNPEKVPYGHYSEIRNAMLVERDLGPIYGFQWRHFGAEYRGFDVDYTGEGVDQLKRVVEGLKNLEGTEDRRMLVNSWNPVDINSMALPPCHYNFRIDVTGKKLNLSWDQRSVDVPLGLPFNIASYATLLHLLAKEANLEEGKLTGHLGNTHIYLDQVDGIETQLSREPLTLPGIVTKDFTNIFDWNYMDTKLTDYKSHPEIKFPKAV